MSYAGAKLSIIDILSSAPLTVVAAGFAPKPAVHAPHGDLDHPSSLRRFWVRSSGHSLVGRCKTHQRRIVADLEVTLSYPRTSDRDALDVQMAADFDALTAQLGDPSRWDRDHIIAIGEYGHPDLSTTIASEVVDDDGRFYLRLSAALHYRS